MFFYGISLSSANASVEWESAVSAGGGDTHTKKLAIKQILLGHDAKPDEFNVVEVTAPHHDKDEKVVKIPVAVLKLGDTQAIRPDLEFPDGPVTFKLISGSGPVHITGLQFYGVAVDYEEFDEEESAFDEDEELADEDDEVDDNPKKKAKIEPKAKPASGGGGGAKETKKK